jgi:hypothetical protein
VGASAALLSLSLAVGAAIAPATATQVGVAAAVNPDAFSSLSGKPQSQLNIGKSIFFNERIKTTDSGLVQVLLVDGSTFTVGPDSDLVIDKFVYDANSGTGQIAASFSKGVMRFVGGKISKSDNAVKIDTPAGAMAVRGCIVLAQVKGLDIAAILVFGDHLKLKNFVVYEPGNGVFLTANGGGEVKKAPPALISGLMAGLSNNQGNNNNAANKPSNPGPTGQLINTASLNELIQNANTQEIITAASAVKPVDSQPQTQPQGQLQGYAAGGYVAQDSVSQGGLAQSQSTDYPDLNREFGTLANRSAEDVNFNFNEDGQTFSAQYRLHVGGPDDNQGGILINYGDRQPPANPEDAHSFVDPETGILLAVNGADNPNDLKEVNGITIFQDDNRKATLVGDPFAFLIGSGNVGDISQSAQEYGPPPQPALCYDCSFMRWGAFGALASFNDSDDPNLPNPRDVGLLGWWVAGDLATVGDLPSNGTATYSGGAIAQVASNLSGSQYSSAYGQDGWTTYTATGKMDMSWDFGSRKGDMTISKFDRRHFYGGLEFKFDLCAPGKGCAMPSGNHFGGKLTESPTVGDKALDGFALGSFAKGPSNFENGKPIKGSVPQGVLGNWGVGNEHYKASGIFAGRNVPNVPD